MEVKPGLVYSQGHKPVVRGLRLSCLPRTAGQMLLLGSLACAAEEPPRISYISTESCICCFFSLDLAVQSQCCRNTAGCSSSCEKPGLT